MFGVEQLDKLLMRDFKGCSNGSLQDVVVKWNALNGICSTMEIAKKAPTMNDGWGKKRRRWVMDQLKISCVENEADGPDTDRDQLADFSTADGTKCIK